MIIRVCASAEHEHGQKLHIEVTQNVRKKKKNDSQPTDDAESIPEENRNRTGSDQSFC